MTDIEKKVVVPASALPRLRDEWMRATGAGQAAEAARQVAQASFTQYQQHLGTILEMLGLDPKQQWFVDFNSGEVSDKDPSQTQTNGATLPLGN